MKLKNKNLKILGVIGLILLTFFFVNYLLDTCMNGVIKEFVYKKIGYYHYSTSFIDDNNYLALNWLTLKPFLKYAFLVVLSILVITIITVKIVDKKKYNQLILELTEKLDLSSPETIDLPEEYKQLENKINDGKLVIAKNRQRAKEAEDRKNDLLVYLAHDLKTPLTSVIGYLNFLEETPELPIKQRKKYTKLVLDKSYRLEELINELFDVARWNNEKIILNKRKINLLLMLEQLKEDFYPVLKKEKKKLKITTKEEKLMIEVDTDKMARVFSNLIKNAISYSPKESIIEVTCQREGEWIQIDFSNEGEKIPESKLVHIFEKFYRVDESRGSKTGNAGVGLAIAKEIIDLHEGAIWVESTEKKTTFHIKLPVQES